MAGDYATDIYQDTINNYKKARKKRVLTHLKCYVDEYEDLYNRFEQYEEVLNELYKFCSHTHMPNTINYPFYVKRTYDVEKPKYSWQLYLLWLEYEEDKKAFVNKYNSIRRKKEIKIHNNLIEQLRIVHKLILSNTYDDVKVIKTFDRDTACELGCPSEEYVSSDWKSEVKFDDNFDKFLSNCMLDKCQSYTFVISDNGKIFDFILVNKE